MLQHAIEVEDRMYESRIKTGELEPNEHKRSSDDSTTATEACA